MLYSLISGLRQETILFDSLVSLENYIFKTYFESFKRLEQLNSLRYFFFFLQNVLRPN